MAQDTAQMVIVTQAAVDPTQGVGQIALFDAITHGPAVVAVGATAADARTAIFAVTSAEAVAAVAAKAQIAALTPIAEPATATAEQVATTLNAVIAALKA